MTQTLTASNPFGIVTPEQLADILGVTKETLANWRYEKRGPAYLTNAPGRGRVHYRIRDIEKWLDGNRVPTNECP